MAAGAALIEEVERQPHNRNLLLYPILFNYRHGLELAMKWTIDHYGYLAGVGLDQRDHDLWALWGKYKLIVEGTGPPGDEPLMVIEQIVKDFHDIDAAGLAFRYTKNKNGEIIQLPEEAIDLQNLRQVMEGADNFLDGADALLSVVHRSKQAAR